VSTNDELGAPLADSLEPSLELQFQRVPLVQSELDARGSAVDREEAASGRRPIRARRHRAGRGIESRGLEAGVIPEKSKPPVDGGLRRRRSVYAFFYGGQALCV